MRDVEIQDLILRIPGLSAVDARAIAEDIARRLSETVSEWRGQDAPHLMSMRVRLPHNLRRDEIARVVATEIARALR